MKMYKYLLILIVILSSCEDIFHEEDNEYIVLDKQQEKIDVIKGINALLSKVHDKHYLQLLIRSDELYEDRTRMIPNKEAYEWTTIIDNLYKNLYTAIISANVAISQCNENTEAHIKGELCFLRAYCYLKLTRFFGTPPLVTTTHVDYTLDKPSYTEIYEFIEADLLKAITLLPKNISDARIPYETPISDAAKALIAEVYLSWAGYPIKDESKYVEAAKFSGEVLQSTNYHLLEDVGELWKNKSNHHNENIYSLSFKYEDIVYSYTYDNGEVEIAYSYSKPNEDCLNGFYHTYVQSMELAGHNTLNYSSNYLPKLKFYDAYPLNYRKSIFFNIGEYRANNFGFLDPDPVTNITYYIYDPLNEINLSFREIVCLKGVDQEALIDLEEWFDHGTTVPLYLLRFASTLLTYAEAKARIGELDASAYQAVNTVRRRANKVDLYVPSEFDLQPNLSQEQFIDSVVQERAWELCFEPDGRWFDIVRLDLKDELHEYMLPNDYYFELKQKYLYEVLPEDRFREIPEECLSKDWYFYVIPQKDRWLNPNFEESK